MQVRCVHEDVHDYPAVALDIYFKGKDIESRLELALASRTL